MPVNTPHKQYAAAITKWERGRDCFDGSDAVKAAGIKYLPMLDSHRISQYGGMKQYEDYKMRALFYNAVGRTVEGLAGALFQTTPSIEVPQGLESKLGDITLAGESAELFGLRAVREVLITGRFGILVDVPVEGEAPTPEDNLPYIVGYRAENVIAWRTQKLAGHETLTRVVLLEVVEEPDPKDVFVSGETEQYRVLELTGGVYTQTLWRKPPNSSDFLQFGPVITPTRRGEVLDFIPFVFTGPTSVSPDIQKPPLDDLVNVNLSHYRTSADLEHGRHWTALPTPWVAGAVGGKPDDPLMIGSGTAWQLEKEGRAGMLEFSGQGLGALEKADEQKRKMMATLGARLLEDQPSTSETATAVSMRHAGETATLRTIAQTSEQALTTSLRTFVWWVGTERKPDELEDVVYQINKDFFKAKMDPAELSALMGALQGEAISYETFYEQLKKGEIARPGVSAEEEQMAILERSAALQSLQAPSEETPASYSIVERDGIFYVVDDASGETVGEFETREEAEAAIAELTGGPPGVQPGDESATVGNPWRIVKRKGKWVVIKASTGKVVGTHDTLEKAKAQLRALHANVKE